MIRLRLRMPAYPLITTDPYFNVWSFSDELNSSNTVHWTGKNNKILGTTVIDDITYRFMGIGDGEQAKQLSVDFTAFSTTYEFLCGKAKLTVCFFTPLLCTDIELLSKPISYMEVSIDGAQSAVVNISVAEDLCLNFRQQMPVIIEKVPCKHETIRMGSKEQPILENSGDDLRIDYGYFYLSVNSGTVDSTYKDRISFVTATSKNIAPNNKAVFVFGYDDLYSFKYFGKNCRSVWNSDGHSLSQEIDKAFEDYTSILERCRDFEEKMHNDAVKCANEDYAELLAASYRQVISAHKAVLTPDGKLLWISKENSSNGCAATVDITYPTAPIFMLYNIELLKASLIPIFDYSLSNDWNFDFAPHDIGQFPLANGQEYGKLEHEDHMPVEECGNMLILSSAVVMIEKNMDFIKPYMSLLKKWANYLVDSGYDLDNQLCTDDFAGHLSHNCNLSLKSICALGAFSRICDMFGFADEAEKYINTARGFAADWCEKSLNGDHHMLAFDKPDSFSLKYNLVWDKIFNLNLFDDAVREREIRYYMRKCNKYGIPLDSRENYTKADWLVWSAALSDDVEDFNKIIHCLWLAYNETEDRVPMTDWYVTTDARCKGFRNRSVLGGFWIYLLKNKNIF